MENLNNIIITIVNKITQPYLTSFEIKCKDLEDKRIFKNLFNSKILRKNDIINLNYISSDNNITDANEKINIEIKYTNELSGSNLKEKKYEIIPNELNEGEELSKLIINLFRKK